MSNPQFNETRFDVFVPSTEDAFGIDPTSAIVAGESQRGQDRTVVHFESNRYGAENMMAFVDRCRHAAGRAATRYPTIAKASLPTQALRRVAGYDLESHRFIDVTDAAALSAWAGETLEA